MPLLLRNISSSQALLSTLATVLPRDDNDPLMVDFVAAGGTVVEL